VVVIITPRAFVWDLGPLACRKMEYRFRSYDTFVRHFPGPQGITVDHNMDANFLPADGLKLEYLAECTPGSCSTRSRSWP